MKKTKTLLSADLTSKERFQTIDKYRLVTDRFINVLTEALSLPSMGAASSKRQIEGYKNRRKPKPVVSEASTSSLTPSKKNGDGGGSGGGVGISAGTKDETIQTVAPQADTESDKKQIKPLAVDTKPDVALTASEMEKVK